MFCIKIRSFAVAAFIVARGVEPIDAVLIDGRLVFRFPPEADTATDEYAAVKAKLDALEQSAKPIVARAAR